MNKTIRRPPLGPKGGARPKGSDKSFALYTEAFMTEAIKRLDGQNRDPSYKLLNDIRDMEAVTTKTDAAKKTYISTRTQQFEYAFGMIIRADLPWNFHPAMGRVPTKVTPCGAG